MASTLAASSRPSSPSPSLDHDDSHPPPPLPPPALKSLDLLPAPVPVSSKRQPKPKKMLGDDVIGSVGQGRKGTTTFPATRISRIVKEDKDITVTGKETIFLISLVTEQFIKKLTLSAYGVARLNKRVFVHYKDLALAVHASDSCWFYLEPVIPLPIAKSLVEEKLLSRQPIVGLEDTSNVETGGQTQLLGGNKSSHDDTSSTQVGNGHKDETEHDEEVEEDDEEDDEDDDELPVVADAMQTD